jgi:hypothetical protein
MSDGFYVRVTKRWDRNSGWAQHKWLYYVDLVDRDGVSARTVNVSCHAGEMSEYGMPEGRANDIANKIAAFFNWPVRQFEEKRETNVVLQEVQKS